MRRVQDDISRVEFVGMEYHADASLRPAHYVLEGRTQSGWEITRDGADDLTLGAGYVLLRSERCGVCSTDLARRFLPFPLPQIIGHEVIALDESGQRYVVEINASHAARGLQSECAFCQAGLSSHCPDRLVLGIHDLPGGFGPWILAPREAALALPPGLPGDLAILVEPFAAALHATQRIDLRPGDTLAILGTRRLGLLTIAALAAERRRRRLDCTLLGLSRQPHLRALAKRMGADRAEPPPAPGASQPLADIVIDTTGTPSGLELALQLARREIHLKSTHGKAAVGLLHLTEAVVDEISLRGWGDFEERRLSELTHPESGRPLVLWQSHSPAPAWLLRKTDCISETDPTRAREALRAARSRMPGADLAVVDGASGVDRALRPESDRETGLVRPRGEIAVQPANNGDGPLLAALTERSLHLSTSRCGDFRAALDLFENDPELAISLPQMVSHHLPADRLSDALRLAGDRESIKVVVDHSIRV